MSNDLKINLALAAINGHLAVDTGACNTPRTPEIVNSLMAMTNPLDIDFPTSKKRFHPNSGCLSSDSNSSSSQESKLAGGPTSVQHTCSQLIKAGLKLSIEQKKRKHHSDSDDLLDLDNKVKRINRNESESEEDKCHNPNGLTPEDEERRRRRRERNKIAATKCRLKKRERTNNLVSEAETLETVNVDLKGQLQSLKSEQRHLAEILALHKPACQKNLRPSTTAVSAATTASAIALFNNRLPPVHAVIDTANHHSYQLPQSTTANTPIESSYCAYNSRSLATYNRTPNIIVESVNNNEDEDDYHQTSLTDLDNPTETFLYTNYPSGQAVYGGHNMDGGCVA